MKLHELTLRTDRKRRIRVGRGNGSGRGSYSGRGIKGQKARSGYSRKPGFEGGQSRLIKRIPKLRGFRNPVRPLFVTIKLNDLERVFKNGDVVDMHRLYAHGLIPSRHANTMIKILGTGDLKKKLTLRVHAASASAKEKITKAGGSVIILYDK